MRKYIKPLVAETFNEIVKDNANQIFEVYLKPLKGYKVKRYLVKADIRTEWGRRYLFLRTYNVYGDRIISGWYGDCQTFQIDINANRNLKVSKLHSNIGYFHTSKQEAYDSAINLLRSKKMELNKEIMKLQKDLYSVVE